MAIKSKGWKVPFPKKQLDQPQPQELYEQTPNVPADFQTKLDDFHVLVQMVQNRRNWVKGKYQKEEK